MYIVAVQDLSNGFGYIPKVQTFHSLSDAFVHFNKLAYEARFDFPDMTPLVNMEGEFETTVFYDEGNMKGNGRFVILAKDDYIAAKIQDAVDDSDKTQRLITIGANDVKDEHVKVIRFDHHPIIHLRRKEYVTLQYILRRETENGDEVYDVYFRKADNTIYCENLDEVSFDALIGIYLELD